jgi:hypothetical protein
MNDEVISSYDWESTWPFSSARGNPSKPSPRLVASAWRSNPSHTNETVGTPAASHATETRNTAGVQLPQQPFPDTTPSIRCVASADGRAFTSSSSRGPWRLPNTS